MDPKVVFDRHVFFLIRRLDMRTKQNFLAALDGREDQADFIRAKPVLKNETGRRFTSSDCTTKEC
jgi:hypothetical protein